MPAGTPATVALERAGIAFRVHEFEPRPGERSYGLAAASALGVEPTRVFKTLLANVLHGTVHGAVPGASRRTSTVVGIVPVVAQLSMKQLALAVGAKRAEMREPVAAERLTGYVVGGISPFGQKRRLTTVIDESCELSDTIFVSGGRRGLDLELAPADLVTVLDALVAPVAAW